MTSITIQFSTTAHDTLSRRWENRWSEVIRRTGHTPFSHCDLILSDGNLLGASDSPSSPVVRGNPRGVAVRPPNYQLFGYRRHAVLETPRAMDIESIALTQVGKAFDNTFVADFVSDRFPGARDWRLEDCWFCAELIIWAMEIGQFWGAQQLIWPKNRVSPTDVLLILVTDQRWINRETFWLPVPGLNLDPGEI